MSCAAPIICRILIKPQDVRQTVAEIFSVMRNVAQPFVKPSPTRPYVSHTIWRTVADAADRLYFYESTLSPNVIWVRLDALTKATGSAMSAAASSRTLRFPSSLLANERDRLGHNKRNNRG